MYFVMIYISYTNLSVQEHHNITEKLNAVIEMTKNAFITF